jgi:formylglycine-generating enzyme required for sulfatase activity
VINVGRQDAQAYLGWLSGETGQTYRLPSEAEWEYACRARTSTRYSFGDSIAPKDANYSESQLGRTSEVGAYPANPWGLRDMHGNVWEWVEDDWHDSYGGAPDDGSAWKEAESDSANRRFTGDSFPLGKFIPISPISTAGGSFASIRFSSQLLTGRGGCWNSDPRHCRSACRASGNAGSRSEVLGFRAARTLV